LDDRPGRRPPVQPVRQGPPAQAGAGQAQPRGGHVSVAAQVTRECVRRSGSAVIPVVTSARSSPMIEAKCPRCEQVWYTEKTRGCRVRLCSDCADELRRHGRNPFRIDAFLIATACFLFVDLFFILLAGLRPEIFGKALLVYGRVLLVPGCVVFVLVTYATSQGRLREDYGDIDWNLARWPLMIALVGLACVLAYYSFVGPG